MSRNKRHRTDKRSSSNLARTSESPSRRVMKNSVRIVQKDRDHDKYYWIDKVLKTEEKDPSLRWKNSGFRELNSNRRSMSISSYSSRCSCTSMRRCSSHNRRFIKRFSRSPNLRRSRRSLSFRRESSFYRSRSPYRTRRSPLTLYSRRRRTSPSKAPSENRSRVRRSRSLSRRRRSPIPKHRHRIGIIPPPTKRRGSKKHGLKRLRTSVAEEVRSSNASKCLNSHCLCRARTPIAKHEQPPEPLTRPKSPKMSSPVISVYEHSRSRSFSVPKYTPIESSASMIPNASSSPEPVPTKKKSTKKMKSHKKKRSHRSKSLKIDVSVLHQPTIQVESMPKEEYRVGGPYMPMSYSGGQSTLYDRFRKIVQMCPAHELPQRSLRVIPDNNVRVGIASFSTPVLGSSVPVGTSHGDIKGRYAYYKYQGYLNDLTFTDYIKWEEWWYKYQDQLEVQRAYGAYLGSYIDRQYRGEPPMF